ncbi:MAG: diphosphate--fructose-6-phosphate 1-phosphotransferase [Phycisphaeraceae bacterium]|nr:diphosphate--fructose-6-phosphate 1-phosphotransferase [Phycisphaeraceae bacterium]
MPPSLPKGNAIIGQSGGPTAVINQSLVGAVLALQELKPVRKIIGMRHGVNGLVADQLVDLSRTPAKHLEAVARTPSAALGSSRDKPDPEYCARIVEACRKYDVRSFFYIGGNDSSDTCRIVNEIANTRENYELRCFHIPKTIDNDLVLSDHTPGFPSAARFQAMAFEADSLDNASLPGVKINIVMGRHAGFLTGAAALARGDGRDRDRNGPHLVYLPEVPFDPERFLSDIGRIYARLGRCQVAVSEGIQTPDGRPIVTTLMQHLDRDAHGNVQLSGVGALGDALADHVRRNLKVAGGKSLRVRADTFGYIQRAWPDPSPLDAREARAAAKFAVRMFAKGDTSGSVAITRRKGRAYKAELRAIELSDVAGKTRHMPAEFIAGHNDVSDAFIRWCRPLVGKLPPTARL